MDSPIDVTAALATIPDRDLHGLDFAIDASPNVVPGLLAWLEAAVDWEINRRAGMFYRLLGPRAAIDDTETDVSLTTLARHGIQEADLYDPCINIHVGAWLLASEFGRHGVSWEGVGAYNAACTQLRGNDCKAARAKYAWLVYRSLRIASKPTIASAIGAPATRAETTYGPLLAVRVAP